MKREMTTEARSTQSGRGLAAGLVFLAMLLAAFSLWTAIPLSWIYIASKVSHTQFPSGGPYAVVVVGILASVLFVAWLIGRLNNLYIRITGTNRVGSMRPAWLKSMRDTSRSDQLGDRGRSGADGLGDARRARPHHLVLPARRLADPEPVGKPRENCCETFTFRGQHVSIDWLGCQNADDERSLDRRAAGRSQPPG